MVVMTLWPVSEEKVSGWTNSWAARVMATRTSILFCCSSADEFGGLVGGDSAGDADEHARCFSVHETPSPPWYLTCKIQIDKGVALGESLSLLITNWYIWIHPRATCASLSIICVVSIGHRWHRLCTGSAVAEGSLVWHQLAQTRYVGTLTSGQ